MMRARVPLGTLALRTVHHDMQKGSRSAFFSLSISAMVHTLRLQYPFARRIGDALPNPALTSTSCITMIG